MYFRLICRFHKILFLIKKNHTEKDFFAGGFFFPPKFIEFFLCTKYVNKTGFPEHTV